MSDGAGAGGHGHGGLYGDPAAADHFTAFDHDDFFFQRTPYAGEGSGGGDGLTTPYSSITDYLQGFLDPAGLAAHLDVPCRLGDDDAVKQEMEVRLIRHDGPAASAPVTPNSSSVLSSSSCEAGGADEETQRRCKNMLEGEEEEQEMDAEGSAADRNCKRSKAAEKKARGEKKPREPRVAFMTKSEVDHLEDGYRWRKYGQKAVKNSSYPRSYYRCTAARCGVKKRVERSHQDPSTVVTTYEGQHTHPRPASLLVRGGAGGGAYAAPPPQLGLGFRPDLRAMIDSYAHGTRMAPGSLLLPRPAGLPSPAPGLLQEHRRSSSHLAAAYGGAVLDFVPSAMGDGHA
ncbi:hypothetical protein SETIT_3G131100v2 [Setaria italica]|uniref:WRKY domain-containing protein n=1 Tax=Setaria italica TaxID=4555 RepID=K3Z7P8_SETIT|nr:probable WRKY transcription factor 57 [Setaria italica]RCV16348.1 hypothetical protein SETIT_3G131100v2 [Setaria italica]